MSNHHARLKHLEKLSAIAKLKSKSLAAKLESIALQATVSALTDEELKAHYDKAMEDFRTDPAILTLTTTELINLYTEKLKNGT